MADFGTSAAIGRCANYVDIDRVETETKEGVTQKRSGSIFGFFSCFSFSKESSRKNRYSTTEFRNRAHTSNVCGKDADVVNCFKLFDANPLILSVSQLPASSILVAGTEDGVISFCDWSKGDASASCKDHSKSISCFSNDEKNSILFAGSRDRKITSLKYQKEDLSRTTSSEFTITEAHNLNISALAHDNNNNLIFSGSRDTSVKCWDVCSGQLLSTYQVPRNIVTCMKYDREKKILFQGSEDLKIRIYDVSTNNVSLEVGPKSELSSFTYFPLCLSSSEGRYLLTGCKGFDRTGCTVKLWDLHMPDSPIIEYTGHTQDVISCEFISSNTSAECTRVASVSKDGCVRLWSINTKSCLSETTVKEPLTAANIDSNGTRVVSSVSGKISVFQLNNSDEFILVSASS